jgi:hypothetical protein
MTSNTVEYSRTSVKLISFSPACKKEFDAIMLTEGGDSVEGLRNRLEKVKNRLYVSYIAEIALAWTLFIALTLVKKEFTLNYKSRTVTFVYWFTCFFHLPPVILTGYFIVNFRKMISLIYSVSRNKCAPEFAAGYFESSAQLNNSYYVSYALLQGGLIISTALDIFLFINYAKKLTEAPDTPEDRAQ